MPRAEEGEGMLSMGCKTTGVSTTNDVESGCEVALVSADRPSSTASSDGSNGYQDEEGEGMRGVCTRNVELG
jgi:hypothetical protein